MHTYTLKWTLFLQVDQLLFSFSGAQPGIKGAVEGFPILCYRCNYLSIAHLIHLYPVCIPPSDLPSVGSQLNVPSCLTLLPGQFQMLKEVVDKERSRRRTRTPTRAPPSPLSVPLVGEIPPWVETMYGSSITISVCVYDCVNINNVYAWQVFPTCVPNRGWSPFRETPRLWQHAAPSWQRWMLTGCHDSTGPQRVNIHWTSGRHSCKHHLQFKHHTLSVYFVFAPDLCSGIIVWLSGTKVVMWLMLKIR